MDEAELIAQGLHDDRQERIAALEEKNTRQGAEVERLRGEVEKANARRKIAQDDRNAFELANTPLLARVAALEKQLSEADDGWRAAIDSWRKCSSKRLSWESGGHCAHCSPLRALLSRIPPVTGTTSDSAPIRQPEPGAQTCHVVVSGVMCGHGIRKDGTCLVGHLPDRAAASDNSNNFRHLATTIGELRPGAIFRTIDGILAVKSEYRMPNGQWQCVLLASGEYAHFERGNATSVIEVPAGGPEQDRGAATLRPVHDPASCPDCGGAAGPAKDGR